MWQYTSKDGGIIHTTVIDENHFVNLLRFLRQCDASIMVSDTLVTACYVDSCGEVAMISVEKTA